MVSNNDGKTGSGMMGAAIMGAVVGAAAVALLNKDMRKKLKSSIMDSLEKGDAKLDEAVRQVGAMKSQATKRTVEKLRDVRKKIEDKV
jgi:gas vesicle protein